MSKNTYPGHAFTLGVLALVLGILCSIYSAMTEVTARRYRGQGVEAEATVSGGARFATHRRSPGLYSLDVSFLTSSDEGESESDTDPFSFSDADLALGGFVSTQIDELLSARLYGEALEEESARVLYLPADPEQVVLAMSIHRRNYPWIGRFELAIGLLVAGVVLLRLHVWRNRNRQAAALSSVEKSPP